MPYIIKSSFNLLNYSKSMQEFFNSYSKSCFDISKTLAIPFDLKPYSLVKPEKKEVAPKISPLFIFLFNTVNFYNF